MRPDQVVTLLVGTERRELVWTPEVAAQWTTVERQALAVLSVTPTPAPMVWVDASQHPELGEVIRLALHTRTWEATCQWLALLSADLHLAESLLSLEVTRPLAYPVVIHFQFVRHRTLLAHIARGGAFHLALEAVGQVLPCVSVGVSGLAEHLAAAAALE